MTAMFQPYFAQRCPGCQQSFCCPREQAARIYCRACEDKVEPELPRWPGGIDDLEV